MKIVLTKYINDKDCVFTYENGKWSEENGEKYYGEFLVDVDDTVREYLLDEVVETPGLYINNGFVRTSDVGKFRIKCIIKNKEDRSFIILDKERSSLYIEDLKGDTLLIEGKKEDLVREVELIRKYMQNCIREVIDNGQSIRNIDDLEDMRSIFGEKENKENVIEEEKVEETIRDIFRAHQNMAIVYFIPHDEEIISVWPTHSPLFSECLYLEMDEDDYRSFHVSFINDNILNDQLIMGYGHRNALIRRYHNSDDVTVVRNEDNGSSRMKKTITTEDGLTLTCQRDGHMYDLKFSLYDYDIPKGNLYMIIKGERSFIKHTLAEETYKRLNKDFPCFDFYQ